MAELTIDNSHRVIWKFPFDGPRLTVRLVAPIIRHVAHDAHETGALPVDLRLGGAEPCARRHRPPDPARRDLRRQHELHRAVHGDVWAQPRPPVEVWRELLKRVRTAATAFRDEEPTAR